ncbi:aspartyl protease family protein [Novosphingobium sp. G106]|uniref:aspartyl protease family protein n=1 Tax=Novosphingobium sp. G106 TaxID=2849500 RepID=UPI001C2D8EF0|nr:aspartyl protease family protein [Novosphingobium sp. G106]MBV1692596.1 aspartyl protease family protein [Novosphingobium sp. G106]
MLTIALALPVLGISGSLGASAPTPEPGWYPLDLDRDRYLTVPVSINGRTLRAVVDSGSLRSILRHDLALEMGLPYLGQTLVQTFTEQLPGELYKLDSFEMFGVSVKHLAIGGFDLAQMEAVNRLDLPFVVGQDVLTSIDLQVDFVGKRMRAFKPGHTPIGPDHKQVNLYGANEGFPAIALTIEGHHHGDAIVDLGSNVTMMMSADFVRETGLLNGRRTSTAVTAGIEGTSLGEIFCINDVKMGPFHLKSLPVHILEDWEMAQPIYVGWPFFRAFDVFMRLRNETFHLMADAALLAADFPKDRSGLGGQRAPDGIRVVHVARNSPGWNAGLREGDVIKSIDGRQITTTYPARGQRFGYGPAGKAIQLGLLDGRVVSLTLSDYF